MTDDNTLHIPATTFIKGIEQFQLSPNTSDDGDSNISNDTSAPFDLVSKHQPNLRTIPTDPMSSSSITTSPSSNSAGNDTPKPPPARIDNTRRSLYTRHAAIVDALSHSQSVLKQAETRLKESEAHARASAGAAKNAYEEKKKLENEARRLKQLSNSHSGPLAAFLNSSARSKKKEDLQQKYNQIIEQLEKVKRCAQFKAEDARTAFCTVSYNEEQRDSLAQDVKAWQSSRDTLRSILRFVYEGESAGDEEENKMEREWSQVQEQYHNALRAKELQRRALIRLDDAMIKIEHAEKCFEQVFSKMNFLFGDNENTGKALKAMKKSLEAFSEAMEINSNLNNANKEEVTQMKEKVIEMIEHKTEKDISRTELKKISNKIESLKDSITECENAQRNIVEQKVVELDAIEQKYDDMTERLSAIRKRLMEDALTYYENHPEVSV